MRRAPRVLDGWTPRTHYVYDDDGRLIESWTDPEWDEGEVAWVLALADWHTEHLCPICGGPKDVCQGPEMGRYVYGTEPPVRCHITTALAVARKEWKDAPHPEALLFAPTIRKWGGETQEQDEGSQSSA